MGDRRLDREAQYWKLTSVLLLSVAALVLTALSFPHLSSGLLIAALVIAICSLIIIRSQRALLQDFQAELERQLPVDSNTGATSFFWFQRMLEQECRRAIREFSPVSVMRLLPVSSDSTLHKADLIESLHKRMTRPGDLVALDTSRGLWLLMPATNEAVSGFAKRVFELVNQQAGNTHLISFTFQPTADLNQAKVVDLFTLLENELIDSTEPQLHCDAEGFDMPSVTYSL